MVSMNVFRILGDVSHAASKCILVWAIHSNKSAEGVSLLTQLMYTLVFVGRYLDLFWVKPSYSYWNFSLKIFYISSSIYIIVLMLRVFARTREREKAWKLAVYTVGGDILAAPFLTFVFQWLSIGGERSTLFEIIYNFSLILEAFCILPQLILLRQTTVPTVIDSFYLVTLGSYRGFYILNWIYRAAHRDYERTIKVISGIIQTAFYLDFAWVYWTRQRVKLRGGSIIDSEDLRKGFLVNRVIDHRTSLDDEENTDTTPTNDGTAPGKKVNRWGNRGVSISADDTLARQDRIRTENANREQHDDAFLSDEDDGDAPVLSSHAEWQEAPVGQSAKR